LKISSTHATDNIDNPGKNQSKRKILGPTSKVTLETSLVTRDYQRKISQIALAGNSLKCK
jgi:hypothetical protein